MPGKPWQLTGKAEAKGVRSARFTGQHFGGKGFGPGSGVTTVAMADAAHALVLHPKNAGAGETVLTGNIVFCDPESGGASEILTLPAVADSAGLWIDIYNTGGEGIVVKDVAANTVITLDTAQSGRVACNGTVWAGFIGGVT